MSKKSKNNQKSRPLPKLCAGSPISCSVELAHELIYGALEYAVAFGLKPHVDFYNLKADLMLDPPDVHPRVNAVTFGKNGMPFYPSGPYDSEMMSRSVINTLTRTCGPDNFRHMVLAGGLPDE